MLALVGGKINSPKAQRRAHIVAGDLAALWTHNFVLLARKEYASAGLGGYQLA
jgi:hypothetical protein